MMKITLLLLAIGSTAVAQITSEKPVTVPILTAAPGRQLQAAVASDGNRFLAAWTDQRTVPDGLYAARVDENGALLDTTGIRLDVHPASGSRPFILFAGDTYSLFWTEQTFTTTSSTMSIHVARIDRDGNIVDPPRLVLDDAYAVPEATASNGTRMTIFLRRNLVLRSTGERERQCDGGIPALCDGADLRRCRARLRPRCASGACACRAEMKMPIARRERRSARAAPRLSS